MARAGQPRSLLRRQVISRFVSVAPAYHDEIIDTNRNVSGAREGADQQPAYLLSSFRANGNLRHQPREHRRVHFNGVGRPFLLHVQVAIHYALAVSVLRANRRPYAALPVFNDTLLID